MRVIAGSARHLPLQTVPGRTTRPTTDRIKETLFNMLQNAVFDCRFLDLFSGSGAIGIEALSRGAKEAVFVEKNREAAGCIRQNLKFTHLEEKAVLKQDDVFQALQKLEGHETFDIIFMDPPYEQELERKVLEYLAGSSLAGDQTLLIAEASLNTAFDYLEPLGYELVKYKKYKTNAHVFIKKNEGRSYEAGSLSGQF